MSERIEIGKVCYKGNHLALHGEEDFGFCGSKYWATLYLTIEEDFPNPRGEEFSIEDAAEQLKRIVANAEAHAWCDADPE